MFRSTRIDIPSKLFISSLFFGTGWFSLSFTFPLLAQNIGFSYTVIGALGFVAALPFPFVAYIYIHSGHRMLRFGSIIPLISLAILSLIFYFYYNHYFITLTVISCIMQAPWWISTEISIGSFAGRRNAEKYSAGWGIPNAVAPLVMGALIQISGYELIFIISLFAFLIAFVFSPKPGKFIDKEGQKPIRATFLFSLFFAGLFSGFIYFVLEPLLKVNSFSYVLIGTVASIYGVVAAIGYVILNYVGEHKISTYSSLASLLIFPTAIIGLGVNLYTVISAVILAGFGVSISMSKVLSYISSSSNIRQGVFFYETLFGVGFMVGSFLQGTLLEYFGKITIFVLFLAPLFYGIYALTLKE